MSSSEETRYRGLTIAIRRFAALAAVLALGLACLETASRAGADAPMAWPVLVVNSSSQTATDIGPGGTTTLTVGDDPESVAITPDGQYAYIPYNLDGEEQAGVAVVDGAGSAAPSVSSFHLWIGNRPTAIAITPDGQYAYVVNSGSSTVSVIDGADTPDPSVSSSALAVGNLPIGIALNPDGQFGYVTNWNQGTVSIIDGPETGNPSVSSTVLSVGSHPSSIAFTPDGQYAYVLDQGTNSVSVIDGADSADPVVSNVVLDVGSDTGQGAEFGGLAATPDGQYLYVVNRAAGSVSIIDGADTSAPTVSGSTLSVGTEPTSIALTPDGQTGYVTNAVTGTVSVISGADSSTPSVGSSFFVSQYFPGAVAVDPVQIADQNSPQTVSITSNPPTVGYVGGKNYVVSSSDTSGLPIELSIDESSASNCQVAGNTVAFTGVGTCTIDANVDGDLEYAPANGCSTGHSGRSRIRFD